MVARVKRRWPALKHGVFSTIAVLPGENRAEFEKLHKDLRTELAPVGALEDDVVANLARLIWRKRNLATFRIAELANGHADQIRRDLMPTVAYEEHDITMLGVPTVDPAEIEAAEEEAENQSRKELGATYELVEHSDLVTLDQLSSELDMHERLDAMTDRCLKRLLFVRGLKSMSGGSSTGSSSKPAALPRAVS